MNIFQTIQFETPLTADLAYGVDRGEHVDRPHGLGHAVLRREEVEVEDAAVVLDDHGLVAEEGDALELEERVVERVREHVPRPLGHHDGDHDEEQLEVVEGREGWQVRQTDAT